MNFSQGQSAHYEHTLHQDLLYNFSVTTMMGIGNCYQDCYDDCHTQEVSDLKINVSDYSEICYQSCNDQNLANNATCGSEVSWILGFGLIIKKITIKILIPFFA